MSNDLTPHVVSVLSGKGGVGKTTVMLSLGAAVAAAGGRVLVVDMDLQCNATALLDPVLPDPAFTVYDVVFAGTDGAAWSAVYPSAWTSLPGIADNGGVLDVLPGDPQMTDQHVIEHGVHALATALQGAEELYDLVLIDNPPSTGLVVQSSLAAASRALLVSQPQHLSLLGLSQSMRLLEQFNDAAGENHWGEVELGGVVINQFDGRRTEHREALTEVRAGFGRLFLEPAIPERAVVQKSTAAHYPLLSYPDGAARSLGAVFNRLSSLVLRSFQDPLLGTLTLRLGGMPLDSVDLVADVEDEGVLR